MEQVEVDQIRFHSSHLTLEMNNSLFWFHEFEQLLLNEDINVKYFSSKVFEFGNLNLK
jgi:hypothetical protein